MVMSMEDDKRPPEKIYMTNEVIAFQEFPDEISAQEFASKLAAANIDYKIAKIPPLLDRIYIGHSSMSSTVVKIREADFVRAREVMTAYYEDLVKDIERDYYLFDFSTQELKDIVSKPDEWGPFDYQLAKKILAERNETVNTDSIPEILRERKAKLSEPDSADTGLYIAAWFFIVWGILSIFYNRIDLMPYMMLVSFMSFVIGIRIYQGKKTLPDGERVWTFKESDRKHGMIIMYLGLAVFLVKMIYYMFYF